MVFLEIIELLAPILLGAATILGIVLSFLCYRVERKLWDRKNIDLSNYKVKSQLFYILNSPVVGVLAAIGGGIALVCGVLCLFSAMVRLYVIAAVFAAVINGVVAFLSLTRKKSGRDMRVFDNYYVQVENVLARKDRTLSNIEVCKKRVDALRERLMQTVRDFNRNLAKDISDQFVLALFAPIDKMIVAYVEDINIFSARVENNFANALHAFLYDRVEPEFQTVPLRSFDESAVDDLLTKIKASYGGEIAAMVVEQVQSGSVKSAKSLGNIMTLLHGLDVVMDDEMLVRFLEAAASFEDRGELAALLYRNKQIPANMVRDTFLAGDWEWIFVPPMFAAYNRRELGMILKALLQANAAGRCYRMLAGADAASLDVLETALQEAQEQNTATTVTAAYRLILSNAYAVGNSGNLYENIAFMLYDRKDCIGLSGEDSKKLDDIVRSRSFYWARRELAEWYEEAVKSNAPLVGSATRILLQYIISGQKDFLDPARLSALFNEYKETLSFADLSAMRLLIAGWLLLTSEDVSVLQAVLYEMRKLPVRDLQAGDATVENSRNFGTALIGYVGEKYLSQLRALLYRTECQRQMLDRIVQI